MVSSNILIAKNNATRACINLLYQAYAYNNLIISRLTEVKYNARLDFSGLQLNVGFLFELKRGKYG